MSIIRRTLRFRAAVALCACWLTSAAIAEPVCARRDAAAPGLESLSAAMQHGRFVAYSPTAIKVIAGHPTRADGASIRADLAVLRPRFDSLVTYGALNGAESIPEFADALDFRALVIGIWNPFDDTEVAAALAAAARYPRLVVGISVGNELLFAKRRPSAALVRRIEEIRTRLPRLPLATTEPFHVFYGAEARGLLGELDFLLVNVHPVFQPWFRNAPDANAAAFVTGVVEELSRAYCGPILVKETGVPTAPDYKGFSDARQASFYRELRQRFAPTGQRAFAYFTAFDAPWRVADEQASPGVHPEEAHWGLYEEGRKPKPVVREIPELVR